MHSKLIHLGKKDILHYLRIFAICAIYAISVIFSEGFLSYGDLKERKPKVAQLISNLTKIRMVTGYLIR